MQQSHSLFLLLSQMLRKRKNKLFVKGTCIINHACFILPCNIKHGSEGMKQQKDASV